MFSYQNLHAHIFKHPSTYSVWHMEAQVSQLEVKKRNCLQKLKEHSVSVITEVGYFY